MRKRNRQPHEVLMRDGTVVPVVPKIVVGLRRTHNGDGLYRRVIATTPDGVAYETHSRSGWRLAVNQQQTIEQFSRLYQEGGAA